MAKTGLKHIDDLVARAMHGDGLAFTALWDEYIDDLRSYIRKMVKNFDDLYVDDICSRSFEKAFRQIGSFDPEKSQFFTWLRVIAHNTALDLIDRENRVHPKNQVVYIDDDRKTVSVMDSLQDQIDTPLDSIIRSEDEEEKTGYIEKLPELYREVARLRMIEGLQYKEISESLDMELNTVRTRLRRARALIEKMKEEDE